MKAKLYRFPVVLAGLLLITIAGQVVLAQPPDQGERKHRKERVETVIIGKFASELELTPEQAERFFPLFREFRGSAEAIQHRQHSIREQLDMISGGDNSGQANIGDLLDQQERNQQEAIRLKRDFLNKVGGFLTPQQVSRCTVLLDELPFKVQRLIEDERMRQHQNQPRRQRFQ